MSNFYNQASWVLVPSGIEEDIVFAQKPISGLGDLTFTRASDATYTDSTGVVRRSPYNLLQQSEAFNNAVWISDGTTTVTANAYTAPNGTLTADRLQMSISQRRYIYQTITPTQTTYTYSVYLRANSNQTVRISVDQGCANYRGGLICNVTTEWQRFSITLSNIVISSGVVAVVIDNITSNTNACTGTAVGVDIFAWGAQIVEGTSALDYFPTTNRQDVPRIDFRNADGTLSSCGRLLLEPQRTNSIRNSSMVGAVAGTPGTLPTNWIASNAGLTQTIVGVGTELGLPYVDIRLNGTASGAFFNLFTEGPTQVVASNGQTWTNAMYMKIVAAPNPYNSILNNFSERTAAGSLLVGTQQAITLTSTLTRFSFTRTNTNAATERINGGYQGTLTVGQSYDFTIRIAAPQMELGGYATTWVPTTTAAVTRLADAASKTGVSSLIGQTEGTLFVDIVPIDVTTTNAIGINAASTSDRILIFTGSGLIFAQVRVGGISQFNVNTSASVGVRYKAAIAYKGSDFAFYLNGTQIGVSSTGTVPACSVISYDTGTGISPFVGRNNQAALFPTRLSNAELAQLTTL